MPISRSTPKWGGYKNRATVHAPPESSFTPFSSKLSMGHFILLSCKSDPLLLPGSLCGGHGLDRGGPCVFASVARKGLPTSAPIHTSINATPSHHILSFLTPDSFQRSVKRGIETTLPLSCHILFCLQYTIIVLKLAFHHLLSLFPATSIPRLAVRSFASSSYSTKFSAEQQTKHTNSSSPSRRELG